MGYFRRHVDRGRAARDKAQAMPPVIAPTAWLAGDGSPPAQVRFVRFATDVPGVDSHVPLGLFRALHLLEDEAVLSPRQSKRLNATLRWFNRHLPVPRGISQRSVCWFRADATELVDRLRDLVRTYKAHNFAVTVYSTSRPGRIVYEDAFQVAAVPFRDVTPEQQAI
jgi:hypothetical protein